MISILKYTIAFLLGSFMLKNKKKILVLCAGLATGMGNISKNPEAFLKRTELRVKKINKTVSVNACEFYSRNPELLGIKIQQPKACRKVLARKGE